MTQLTSPQEALAQDLRDLELAELGGQVLEGRTSIPKALLSIKAKREFKVALLNWGLLDTAERERLSAWCEKAKFTLEHWADYLEDES